MKILVCDPVSPKGIALLQQRPEFEVVVLEKRLPEAELLPVVKDVAAMVVRSETKVTAKVIAAAPQLRVVGRAGVGVDNVDCAAARKMEDPARGYSLCRRRARGRNCRWPDRVGARPGARGDRVERRRDDRHQATESGFDRRVCGGQSYRAEIRRAVRDRNLHFAHRRTQRAGLDCDVTRQLAPARRYHLRRRE